MIAMTSKEILKIKAIAALIEAMDTEDEDDAKEVLKIIKGLIEGPAKPA
jgi:hypothetical protein